MDRVPIFNVKEVQPLAKNLSFMIRLDAQSHFCVLSPQPPLQLVQISIIHCALPL